MKGSWVLVLIVICVTISTLLYKNKFSEEKDGIDEMIMTLKNVRPYLSPQTHIYVNKGDASTEVFFWMRYALAPVHLSTQDTILDTIFTIQKLENLRPNTSVQVIWQGKDSQYQYTLAKRQ